MLHRLPWLHHMFQGWMMELAEEVERLQQQVENLGRNSQARGHRVARSSWELGKSTFMEGEGGE